MCVAGERIRAQGIEAEELKRALDRSTQAMHGQQAQEIERLAGEMENMRRVSLQNEEEMIQLRRLLIEYETSSKLQVTSSRSVFLAALSSAHFFPLDRRV